LSAAVFAAGAGAGAFAQVYGGADLGAAEKRITAEADATAVKNGLAAARRAEIRAALLGGTETLKNLYASIKTYEDGQMFSSAKEAAAKAYETALGIASERMDALRTAGKNARVANEKESLAWQILGEIYLSPYITPAQRERVTLLAAESLFNLGLTEEQYKTPLEGLDHFFALSILSQSRYSGVETERDYENMARGVSKTGVVPSDIIRKIENSADRPFVSGAYFAAALAAVYNFGGQEAFYASEQRLRAKVLKEEENPYLWADIAGRIKKKLFTAYGNVENYSLKERYSYALCDESVYFLTKDIVNNNFYNPPDKVFQVNSALCLLNAPDASDKQKTDAAAFIEKTYFTKRVETHEPMSGAVLSSRGEPNPDGEFITDLSPKEASLFRQRMINILYKNFAAHGHKYLKGDYSEAVKKADGSVRPEEVIFQAGTFIAECVAVDLVISALTGGTSLTVSLPRWGGRIISLAARSGTETFRVFRAAGLVDGGAIVWGRAAEKSAEALAKIRQIPSAAAQAVKGGMSTAVADPVFAGMTTPVTVGAARVYGTAPGNQVLLQIDRQNFTAAFKNFQELFKKEISSISGGLNAGEITARTQRQIAETEEALSFFENSPVYQKEPWLKEARRLFDFTAKGVNVLPDGGITYVAGKNGRTLLKLNHNAYAPGAQDIKLNIATNKNSLYRAMAMNEGSIRNLYVNGVEVYETAPVIIQHDNGFAAMNDGNRIWMSDAKDINNVVRFAWSKATAEKPLISVVEIDANLPGLKKGFDGVYSTIDIPANKIRKIYALNNVNGQNVWGEIVFKNDNIFFRPLPGR